MPKAAPRKSTMTAAHKQALAKGREEGRVVRRYLEALDASKPKRGRQRTPDSIRKRLAAIDAQIADAGALQRLHLIESKAQLQSSLEQFSAKKDISALEKEFVKVAKDYGERKGISYSSWRQIGVPASVLQSAKIARTRG